MLDEQLIERQVLLLRLVLIQEPLRLRKPDLLGIDPEVFSGIQS